MHDLLNPHHKGLSTLVPQLTIQSMGSGSESYLN